MLLNLTGATRVILTFFFTILHILLAFIVALCIAVTWPRMNLVAPVLAFHSLLITFVFALCAVIASTCKAQKDNDKNNDPDESYFFI